MRLTLAIHNVGSIRLADATWLDGDALSVDPEELRELILQSSK